MTETLHLQNQIDELKKALDDLKDEVKSIDNTFDGEEFYNVRRTADGAEIDCKNLKNVLRVVVSDPKFAKKHFKDVKIKNHTDIMEHLN